MDRRRIQSHITWMLATPAPPAGFLPLDLTLRVTSFSAERTFLENLFETYLFKILVAPTTFCMRLKDFRITHWDASSLISPIALHRSHATVSVCSFFNVACSPTPLHQVTCWPLCLELLSTSFHPHAPSFTRLPLPYHIFTDVCHSIAPYTPPSHHLLGHMAIVKLGLVYFIYLFFVPQDLLCLPWHLVHYHC